MIIDTKEKKRKKERKTKGRTERKTRKKPTGKSAFSGQIGKESSRNTKTSRKYKVYSSQTHRKELQPYPLIPPAKVKWRA